MVRPYEMIKLFNFKYCGVAMNDEYRVELPRSLNTLSRIHEAELGTCMTDRFQAWLFPISKLEPHASFLQQNKVGQFPPPPPHTVVPCIFIL
jgi:hypothetical protein